MCRRAAFHLWPLVIEVIVFLSLHIKKKTKTKIETWEDTDIYKDKENILFPSKEIDLLLCSSHRQRKRRRRR